MGLPDLDRARGRNCGSPRLSARLAFWSTWVLWSWWLYPYRCRHIFRPSTLVLYLTLQALGGSGNTSWEAHRYVPAQGIPCYHHRYTGWCQYLVLPFRWAPSCTQGYRRIPISLLQLLLCSWENGFQPSWLPWMQSRNRDRSARL